MNYKIKLTGNEELIVPEDVGNKVRASIEGGINTGFFKVGRSMYQIRDVRSIVSVDDSKSVELELVARYRELDDEYTKKLDKWAREDAKTKTEREVKSRVKPALMHFNFSPDLQEMARVIYKFFTDNPEYPWCPLNIWIGFFGERKSYPLYFRAVATNDKRVNEYLDIPVQSVGNILSLYEGIDLDA